MMNSPVTVTRNSLEEEAYQHGRTQARLNVAREALKTILSRVNKRSDRMSLEIAGTARRALLHSVPTEESTR